ncbi:MAG: hypothetical protein ACI4YB_08145 [Oscillospiraceae bacterium]
MYWELYRCAFAPPAPDMSVYAAHCIRRKRHIKRRMRQYGRI